MYTKRSYGEEENEKGFQRNMEDGTKAYAVARWDKSVTKEIVENWLKKRGKKKGSFKFGGLTIKFVDQICWSNLMAKPPIFIKVGGLDFRQNLAYKRKLSFKSLVSKSKRSNPIESIQLVNASEALRASNMREKYS